MICQWDEKTRTCINCGWHFPHDHIKLPIASCPHPQANQPIKNISLNTNKRKLKMSFPSFPQRVSNYLASRKTWVAAGKPLRSPEAIRSIFNTHCKPCEHYTETTLGYACDICGCFVNENNDFNKIAWATTRCPLDPPKWVEVTYLPVVESIIEEEMSPESIPSEAIPPDPPIPQEPPKTGGCGCSGH